MAEQAAPDKSPIERGIERARGLLEQGDFNGGLELARNLLRQVPLNRDALYIAAVAERYLGRPQAALETLARLAESAPDYARLYQERGHCLRALGQQAAAIGAYERAVTLNPALPASWGALVELHSDAGNAAAAQAASVHVDHLRRLPEALVAVANLIHEGDLVRAERICRHFLQSNGHHVEAMRLLAQIGSRLDVLDDAEFLLESVLEFAPDYRAARLDYAKVLARRQKFGQARDQLTRLLAADPDNLELLTMQAAALSGLGEHERSAQLYRELLARNPDNALLHLSLGHARRSLGQQADAIAAYRAAAAVRPDFGDAYWSLANLKTYRFTEAELREMRLRVDAAGTSAVDRYHLCFALGKALEDRHEYAESFACYSRGNALKQAETGYNADHMQRDLQLQAEICTAEFFRERAGSGCPKPDPIFIVGLPRAGSTLLEQILASHSQIEGTMELPNIRAFAVQLDGRRRNDEPPRYPASLAQLDREQLRQMGERYLGDTRILRAAAPYFIDKMPNNFRHVGLIQLILPNARIIDARRGAMACCFSLYKQLFAAGQEFSYSLQDIGRYYRDYVALMEHWDRVLPGRILRVQYEDVVADLEGQVRRLLDFCGLPFEPQCVEFHRTARSVRTASSEQVRQPIYREGIDQWQHYAEWLEPLRQTLGPLAELR